MIAKKILPINPNPSIRTCIHHAYPTAIIESDLLANLSIRNEKVEAWETSIKNVKFSVNDNEVSFYQLEPGKAVCAFWRDLKLEEDIIIDVKYLKKRDFIRHIDIFVASDEIENELSLEDKSMGVRWNTYGYFKRKEMYAYDTNLYTFIRFARKDQMITCYASSDGKNWTTLFSSVIEENQYSKIGIDIDFGDDRYNDWKIMNYIQLLYNTSNEYKGISLDYYFFPRKNIDNSYMYYSNYLDTIYDNKTELADLFGSIHDMLHWNISHGYYVNMCLDEFYVPDRAKYQRGHYNHYNLFYGYDDEEKLYYIMGYGKKGSPIISTIPFSMISYEIINNENIVRYKYAINEITHFEFDIKRLIQEIKELYSNEDSSQYVTNLLKEESVLYGISIIKYLATDINGKRDVRHDKRIIFCLMEHSQIMMDRVRYLCKYGFINSVHKDLFLLKLETIYDTLNKALMLVLKNMIKEIPDNRIDSLLMSVYDAEMEFGNELLAALLDFLK